MATLMDAQARLIDVIEASAAGALRTAGDDEGLRMTTSHLRRARLAAEALALLNGTLTSVGDESD